MQDLFWPGLPVVPSCFVAGEDSWSPPRQHEDMSSALTDHPPVVIISDSGHMSTMEQPEAVSKAMYRWLEQSLEQA